MADQNKELLDTFILIFFALPVCILLPLFTFFNEIYQTEIIPASKLYSAKEIVVGQLYPADEATLSQAKKLFVTTLGFGFLEYDFSVQNFGLLRANGKSISYDLVITGASGKQNVLRYGEKKILGRKLESKEISDIFSSFSYSQNSVLNETFWSEQQLKSNEPLLLTFEDIDGSIKLVKYPTLLSIVLLYLFTLIFEITFLNLLKEASMLFSKGVIEYFKS